MTNNEIAERFRKLLYEWLDENAPGDNEFEKTISFVFRHFTMCMTEETINEFIDVFKKDMTHSEFLNDLYRDRSKWEEIRKEWGWST